MSTSTVTNREKDLQDVKKHFSVNSDKDKNNEELYTKMTDVNEERIANLERELRDVKVILLKLNAKIDNSADTTLREDVTICHSLEDRVREEHHVLVTNGKTTEKRKLISTYVFTQHALLL